MQRWRGVTLGEFIEGLSRYRVFVLSLVVILLLAILAPGNRQERETTDAAGAFGPGTGAVAGDGTSGGGFGDGTAGSDGSAASNITGPGGSASGTVRTGAPAGSNTRGGGSVAPALQAGGTQASDPLKAPDCDPATKRMRVPSIFAAPCVPIFPKGGNNGNNTYKGITKDTITVAIRWSEGNAAVSALLIGAGAEDTTEDVRNTRQHWIDFFEAHYETYGRRVKLVYFESSGSDEQAQRADAIKVDTEIKAFAAWGGGGVYRDELVARGIVCICGATMQEQFLKGAPYIWGTQPSLEQWFWPVAEYIGRRLWNRNAKFAGDPTFQTQKRRLGIVYADSTSQPIVVQGIAFLEQRMAKHGAKFIPEGKISYVGDINTAQEQARVIIAKLKDNGITTVMFWGDPIAPIFLTQEATKQAYRPEWVITGGNLVDTTFFGRTYDQVQWEHAFGVSQLWARGPQEQDEVFLQYNWHNGHSPEAAATYEIIYQTVWQFMVGVHLAGPNLNPQTFKAGLFSYPPSGGGPTSVHRSMGRHGFWPWDDYTAFDDTTEVWWDSQAVGTDEIGKDGKGMWRYVDGGKRYLPEAWPSTEPNLFNVEGTVTKYAKLPAVDQYPMYEHKHFRALATG